MADERRRRGRASFLGTFESAAWKQLLEEFRPHLSISNVPKEDIALSDDSYQFARLVEDVDTAEEEIMSRFRDYVLSFGGAAAEFETTIPGLVLRDFLNSLGRREVTFWSTLPLPALERVLHGGRRISARLSEQLSEALGPPPHFWSDLERKYSRWESMPFGRPEVDLLDWKPD